MVCDYVLVTCSYWRKVTLAGHHCPTNPFSSDMYILRIDKNALSLPSWLHPRQGTEWNKRALSSDCFLEQGIF